MLLGISLLEHIYLFLKYWIFHYVEIQTVCLVLPSKLIKVESIISAG